MEAERTHEATPTEAESPAEFADNESNLGSVFCLKSLTMTDDEPIDDASQMEENARVNIERLVNKLFQLEQKRTPDGTYAVLPIKPAIRRPRMQMIPVPKPLTKWQTFAKAKGIKKEKKTRLIWDEIAQDWRPRFGYRGANKLKAKADTAIMEVKPGEDPHEWKAEKYLNDKKIQRAKQEMQEIRNRSKRDGTAPAKRDGKQEGKRDGKQEGKRDGKQGGKRDESALPVGVGHCGKDVTARKRGKEGLKEVMGRAQLSTRSYGRFDEAAKGEAKVHQKKSRKVTPPPSIDAEISLFSKAANLVVRKAAKGATDKVQ